MNFNLEFILFANYLSLLKTNFLFNYFHFILLQFNSYPFSTNLYLLFPVHSFITQISKNFIAVIQVKHFSFSHFILFFI